MPDHPDRGPAYEEGLAVRREVLGAEYVDAAVARANKFNGVLQDLVTTQAWGGPWIREGLTRRERSLLNLGMLAALNRADEFKLHTRGALNNGCTLREIQEVLVQVMGYCGFPAGVTAFKLVGQVLEDMGIDPNGDLDASHAPG